MLDKDSFFKFSILICGYIFFLSKIEVYFGRSLLLFGFKFRLLNFDPFDDNFEVFFDFKLYWLSLIRLDPFFVFLFLKGVKYYLADSVK